MEHKLLNAQGIHDELAPRGEAALGGFHTCGRRERHFLLRKNEKNTNLFSCIRADGCTTTITSRENYDLSKRQLT